MQNNKIARTEKWIRLEITNLLQIKFNSPLLKTITLSEVKVSKDLSYATIFWTTYNQDTLQKLETVSDELEKIKSFCRKHLAQNSATYTVPQLKFKYDETLEKAKKIENILSKLNKKN